MPITCFIRYQFDPQKYVEFEELGKANDEVTQGQQYLLKQTRLFMRLSSAAHAPRVAS